jgi:hypothetical protein
MAIDTASAADPASTAAGGAREGRRDGALLGQAAVLIWNDVAPEGHADFYDWHDREHIPERLSMPGFLRGRRLRAGGHSPEWLTIYEAASLSALVSPEYLARLNAPTPATAATLKYFRNTSRAVCNVVHSVGTSTGGHIVTLRLTIEPARVREVIAHLCDDAFPRAMALTGVIACHLFAADAAASFARTAESETRTFDVPAWVVLLEATHPAAVRNAWKLVDGSALRSDGVTIRPDAGAYELQICRLAQPTSRQLN